VSCYCHVYKTPTQKMDIGKNCSSKGIFGGAVSLLPWEWWNFHFSLSRWTRQLRTGDLFSQDVEFHWLILQILVEIWRYRSWLFAAGWSLPTKPIHADSECVNAADNHMGTAHLSSSVLTNLWVDVCWCIKGRRNPEMNPMEVICFAKADE